ncbi:MAG: hypothetical protein TREMPRED_001182 [Tremellales sp. Tagirdzhanova-0007]|nr:MAG: hypothetical protein TREMPRED_001182 [Tremellales sp. Tagirdzhanova-0007]
MVTLPPGRDQTPLDVLLIGIGSIGSIYAYILEKSGRARVTAVARSNYSLYSTTGATLDTDRFGVIEGWTPHRVVRSQAEALEGDVQYAFCVICTKCLPDILPTAKLVAEGIASHRIGAWSLIQNGLGVEEDLYQAVKDGETPIISSCAWIGIMTSPDGKVVTWRGVETLVSGIYPPLCPPDEPQTRSFSKREVEAAELWKEMLTQGGAKVLMDDRIDSIRFSKNIINCAWSSIQGLTRCVPACFEPLPPELTDFVKKLFREIIDTGFRSGLLRQGMVQYPGGQPMGDAAEVTHFAWSNIYNTSVQKRRSGATPHKMSLLIDVEMGRPFEVEVITGAVLRVAQAHNVAVPLLGYSGSGVIEIKVEVSVVTLAAGPMSEMVSTSAVTVTVMTMHASASRPGELARITATAHTTKVRAEAHATASSGARVVVRTTVRPSVPWRAPTPGAGMTMVHWKFMAVDMVLV